MIERSSFRAQGRSNGFLPAGRQQPNDRFNPHIPLFGMETNFSNHSRHPDEQDQILNVPADPETIERLKRLMRYYSRGDGPSIEEVAKVCLRIGAELYLGEIDNNRLRRFKTQARFISSIFNENAPKRPGPAPRRMPQLPKHYSLA
jgi:hypothetical protein